MTHLLTPALRVACLAFAVSLLSHSLGRADDAATAAKEQELIAVLQSGAPDAKAIACKELAIYGGPRAVPELAKLLADEHLASWARIALEAIPNPEADQALREASDKLSGRLLVGVLNSIGVRRDAAAVPRLTDRLANDDVEVACAAAWALGRVGNDAAAQALRKTLPTAQGEVRNSVAEGCILCAERMLEAGRNDEAIKLYDEVRAADVPKPRLLEATRGAILSRGNDGIPLLVEQLRADDQGRLQIALSTARELPGREVAEALGAELAQTTPERAVMLLAALADRRDAAVTPEVLAAAKAGAAPVRMAAIDIIGRAGNASHLASLLEISADKDAAVSQSAKAALASLPGDDVNRDIAARLKQSQGRELLALLEAVAQRRIAATATLVKLMDSKDDAVRTAALTALGETIEADDLSVLIAHVIDAHHASDAAPARRALRTACLRMPDREGCAHQLASAMASASLDDKVEILSILGAMGGSTSLETISAAVRGKDEALQDAGSRVLGEWMNVDAAPTLLDLARHAASDKLRVRALRGYLRLARQFQMPEDQRAEMCAKAIAAAGRPDEQLLALAVLERYPSVPTLRVALEAGETPSIKDEAQRVALAIAQELDPAASGTAELLGKLGLEPVELEIVKAEYGADNAQRDVTEILRGKSRNLRLISLASTNYNESFGGDPAPGVVKKLTVTYRINGKHGEATFAENAVVLLPMPE